MSAGLVPTIQTNRSACNATRSAVLHFSAKAARASAEPGARTVRLPRRAEATASGRDPLAAARLLGRMLVGTPSETLDTSSHLWPGSEDRTRDAVGLALEILRTSRGLEGDPKGRTAGQRPGADGLAHRPGSVRRTASRRHGWRPSISGCRCRHPPATYPRARAGRPRTLAVWSCSRWGLPSHDGLPSRWWSLAPPFHPYPGSEEPWRSVFCGTDPAGCPGWALPTTLPCGARTFLDTSRRTAR
jgi:hypothetical protein